MDVRKYQMYSNCLLPSTVNVVNVRVHLMKLQPFVGENLSNITLGILQAVELRFEMGNIDGHLLRLEREHNGETQTDAAGDDAHLFLF